MTTPILVTGGTGTLGTLVVQRLREAGRDVRVLTRHPHHTEAGVEYVVGDLATGQGIEAAANGAEIILHLAGDAKGDDVKARNLVRAASGAAHLVYISVVGADRVPIVSGIDRAMFGYFGFKRAAELIIENSGIRFTTVRATQFHDLSFTAVRQISKLPVVPAPAGFRFQPIDADTVAARLVELALGTPAGLVADLGGPRVYPMTELIRSYLDATHKRRPIVQVRMPGKAAAAIRAGVNLTTEHAAGRSWEEFLADRFNARQNGHRAG